MKVQTLVSKINSFEDGWGIQKFWEKDFEGACPCFSASKRVENTTVNVWGRCWRVSDNTQDLYVWGTLAKKDLIKIANALKKALDKQKWYNPYTIIYKDPYKNPKKPTPVEEGE